MPGLNALHAHPWDLTPAQAIEVQHGLRCRVETVSRLPASIERIAGADVGFEAGGRITRAAVAVLRYPGLELSDFSIARVDTAFPYVPGLLSFREVPALLAALEGLTMPPDLLLVDGQGWAHPRRLGLACHLGILADLPAIGVAKTRLIGTHAAVPDSRFAQVPLCDGDEIIGTVLRTRPGVKPLYVSIGHRVDLPTAVHWVRQATTRFRLPETTRWAHRLASGPDPEVHRRSSASR